MGRRKNRVKRFRHTRQSLEYLFFRLMVCTVQALSPRRTRRLAEFLAFCTHHLLPRRLNRYDVARENLRTALGNSATPAQIDGLIYQMWVHLFRVLAELVQLPRKLNLTNLHDVVHFRDSTAVVRAMSSGRPVILLSGHFGNWEMAISVFGLFGFPMGVVARELDNPHLDAWFRRYRQATGHVMLAKKGDYDQMVERLEQAQHLALLGDQDAGSRGLFVDFFGRPASTFKSIALLALRYNALICVGYARRLPDAFEHSGWVQYELGCETVIDPSSFDGDEIREITAAYTEALERVIRRSPEQYFWVHRRWKHAPPVRKQSRGEPRRKAG